MACEGTGLLWQGDFQNARMLLQALMRRADAKSGKAGKSAKPRKSAAKAAEKAAAATPAEAFHLHRQAQAQRARVLASVLIPLEGDYTIDLRRAPDWRQACTEAWGPATGERSVATLRELLGLVGAHEWRKKGVEVPALGAPPLNRIHPHYGVFSPVRGEYVGLVADTALPSKALVFDIGVGSGVLSAVLARRGVQRVVATDQDPRALACARENLQRLGVMPQVELLQADLFPPGRAPLVVCNPPWVPARASSPIEHAVYDEGSRMLKGFLAGLADHLEPGGEGWLILSDLAEHLGLRAPGELAALIAGAGLKVLGRSDIGLTTFSEVEQTLALITDRVRVPVIVDAGVGTASDAAIAMELGMRFHEDYYCFLGAIDLAYQKYSPGKVQMESAQRWAIETGIRRFDFLNDPSTYKSSWTNATEPLTASYVPLTSLGQIYCRLWMAGLRPSLRALYHGIGPAWRARVRGPIDALRRFATRNGSSVSLFLCCLS